MPAGSRPGRDCKWAQLLEGPGLNTDSLGNVILLSAYFYLGPKAAFPKADFSRAYPQTNNFHAVSLDSLKETFLRL
eukprot:4399871-Pleurochrysis_carterae.AAC.3